MKIKNRLVAATFLAGAATLVSPAAMAEDAGWYAGGSLGSARANSDTSAAQFDAELATLGITATSTLSENDTGFKLFAGYQFNKNLAVEGGYVDLGKPIELNSVVTVPVAGTVNATIKNSGWNLDVVGILPINDAFSAFAKVGLYYSKTTADISAAGGGGAAAYSASASETNPKFGLGANYAFTKNVSVRAEWERYKNLGDTNTTGEGDVDLWSIGVAFKF